MRKKKRKEFGQSFESKAGKIWGKRWENTEKNRIRIVDPPAAFRVIKIELSECEWAKAKLKEGQEGLVFELIDEIVKNQEVLFNGTKYRVIYTQDRFDVYSYKILVMPCV